MTTFFQDNILSYLPKMYQSGDYDGIVKLVSLLATHQDQYRQNIIDIPKLVTVDDCPPEFLQNLADLLYYNINRRMPIDQVRSEISKIVDFYRHRGTKYSFERVLKYNGAQIYGVIKPSSFIILLDILPMDSIYVLEDADYNRDGTIDVWANVDPYQFLKELQDVQPLGTRMFLTLLDQFILLGIEGSGFSFEAIATCDVQQVTDPSPGDAILNLYDDSIDVLQILNVDWSRTDIFFDNTSIYMNDIGSNVQLISQDTVLA